MTKVAQLFARMEGFGIPGAIPTVDNNPGDLRHSPHSEHAPGAPNAIGKIYSVADGWADLERQLRIWAERGFTIQQAVYAETGAQVDADGNLVNADGNNASEYLQFVCDGLGLPPETPLSTALQIEGVA